VRSSCIKSVPANETNARNPKRTKAAKRFLSAGGGPVARAVIRPRPKTIGRPNNIVQERCAPGSSRLAKGKRLAAKTIFPWEGKRLPALELETGFVHQTITGKTLSQGVSTSGFGLNVEVGREPREGSCTQHGRAVGGPMARARGAFRPRGAISGWCTSKITPASAFHMWKRSLDSRIVDSLDATRRTGPGIGAGLSQSFRSRLAKGGSGPIAASPVAQVMEQRRLR